MMSCYYLIIDEKFMPFMFTFTFNYHVHVLYVHFDYQLSQITSNHCHNYSAYAALGIYEWLA